MEIIKKSEIKILSNPGVESFQLLNPENSKSERISITRVLVQPNNEQPRHKHDTSEQIWIAVNGKGILLLADNKEEVFEPGDVVRFADGDTGDQKRVMTPAQAKLIGSDYIVVGRPITAAPDPVSAYKRCVAEFCD